MKGKLVRDGIVWGIVLWLIGYILGIIFFLFLPRVLIGWAIMPVGVVVSLYILLKKIKSDKIGYFIKVGIIWSCTAVLFDYLFLVMVFKPPDGYYKPDVYLYYGVTFLLPLLVGWKKSAKK